MGLEKSDTRTLPVTPSEVSRSAPPVFVSQELSSRDACSPRRDCMGRRITTVRAIAALAAVTCVSKTFVLASEVPKEIKKVVGFVFLPVDHDGLRARGTGFFVDVPSEADSSRIVRYIVTAKHVFTNGDEGPWFSKVVIRVNKNAGGVDELPLNLVAEGPHKNVFASTDTTIDIAVATICSDMSRDDVVSFPVDQLTRQEDLPKLHIAEGTEVFFVGMFAAHIGAARNYPIVRFGHMALLSDEKVMWNSIPADVYLIESGSYGGNSGSPVFFYRGEPRADGSITIDYPNLRLAGVMMGTFLDLQPLQNWPSDDVLSKASNGIAGVAPSYHVREIIYSSEVIGSRRGKCN